MIKIGQIGLNFGLKAHIPSFKNDRRFELASVCSYDIKKAKKISEDLGVSHFTDNPGDLFEKVDAVSFAIPPSEQSKWVPKAIKSGLHIFFEKPLGYKAKKLLPVNPSQALMVDFEFLEIDVWKILFNKIKSGELGQILHCEVVWNVETYAVSNNIKTWKTDISQNGGTLNNFGSHVFYYLEELFGSITSISAMSKPEIKLSDETIYLLLRFSSGQAGSVAISTNTYRGSGHTIEVTGSKGTATLKNPTNSTVSDFELKVSYKDGPTQEHKSEWKKGDNEDDRVLAITQLVYKFGDWIERGEIQGPNINAAIRVENLISKTIESINKKKNINV